MFQARFQPSPMERDNKNLQHPLTMLSSKSPWGVGQQTGKKWSMFGTKYETPFGLMDQIMRNWPGASQTSEQEPAIRHRRLVEMIAGYPVIVNGNRPLDIPIHHLSVDALNLSLYFDGIAVDVEQEFSEYSSLRTILLDWDLHKVDLHKVVGRERSFFKLHKPFLQFLIHHIEQFEEIDKLDDEMKSNFQLEKSNFLRALHSFSTNRVQKCWPKNKYDPTRYGELKAPVQGFLLDGQELDESEHEPNGLEINSNTYYEHSVKFEKIQSWIQWYSAKEGVNYPLKENVRHKLMIGASAFLEGAFAKIRSKVLSEKRPGSITIDGGGRICFISTKKDEKEWIQTIIKESLLLDPDLPHPYADVIKKSLKMWGELTHRIQEDRGSSEELEHKIWDPEQSEFIRKEGRIHLGGWLTTNLHGIALKCYPSMSYNNEENTDKSEFYPDPTCAFCMGTDDTKTYSSPSAFLKQSIPDNRGIKNQLCAFHHILYYLGNAAQIRYGSQVSSALSDPSVERKIRHVVILDGNGIGQIFKQELGPFSNPTFHEEEWNAKEKLPENIAKGMDNQKRKKDEFDKMSLPFWEKNKLLISNLKEPWSKVEHLFNQEFNLNLCEQKAVNKLLKNQRRQAYLQRKRRSFNFNAMWWSSFFEGIYEQNDFHLEPFVAAGDDLVLVNRTQSGNKRVIDAVECFNEKLQEKYSENKSLPMSFGAGVAERGEENVAEIIKRARDAEVSAKKSWKRAVSQQGDDWLIKESALDAMLKEDDDNDENNFEEVSIQNKTVPSIIHIWRNEVDE
tara:strand:- start:286 stop:2649 length:2364 start_codon:yes stop_codon:yes gene_type:complete